MVKRVVLAGLSVTLLLGVTACQSNLGRRRVGDEAYAVDTTVTTADLVANWRREGDYLVSPPNEEESVATRVGILVQLAQDGDLPAFEARATHDGEPEGDWVPLGATYSEGDHHVAIADLGQYATGAQLRVPVDALDAISSVVWSATVPDEPPADAPADPGAAVAPLTADLEGLGIVTRAEWGAMPTRCTARDSHRYRMAVHYTDTGSANPDRQIRSIQRYHMDTRGWCDIGYHFLVGIDGRIFEGRPVELLGAHVSGNNTGNIGVSFIGCFHSTGCGGALGPTTPPDVMLDAGGRLLGTLSRLYSIPLDRNAVRGHRDHAGASTDCPGDYLYRRIDQLLSIGASESLGSTAPPPSMPPPSTMPPTPTSCGDVTSCGDCNAAAGCGYCASQGACVDAGTACAYAGAVGTHACGASPLAPCSTASCWNPVANFASCGSWTVDQDFTSGRYSVHRYWAHLFPGGVTTLRLARASGTFTPALLVSDRAGQLVYAGDVASIHPSVHVVSAHDGRDGADATVALTAASDLDVYVYVTDWSVLSASFGGRVSTTAHYHFVASEDCGGAPMSMPPAMAADRYAGITQSGMSIPRQGLTNGTLRSVLGISTEPYGTVTTYGGHSWVSGRVSWFGGPSDTGVGPTDRVAISGEVARSLSTPTSPTAADLAAHPEQYYYVAMRFDYAPNGKTWWRDARLLVTNPRTGAQVVVRPADWGPNTYTGRIIDCGPQVLADLGMTTDDTALVAFAAAGTPLGPVR
jgi:hypothetical protein